MDDKELTIDISREAGVCRVVMRVVGTEDGISGEMADTPPVWERTDPEMYGKKLFEWLLSAKDDNQETIDSFWHQMKGKYPKRHVVLNVWPPDDVPLRTAVWECLNDGGDLLSTSAETTFCRTIDHDRNVPSPLRSGTALKVLLIVPTPSDQTTEFPKLPLLNADEEENSLRTIFENSGYPFELKRMASPCSMEAIATELRDGWHIVHFIGHGTILDREPAILIEDQDGKAIWKEAGKFVLTIRDILGVGGDDEDRRVRLIFLASCDTANTDIDTPRSLAYEIMKAGMPAVIAMQDAVDLKDARNFAKRFYQSLLKEGRVDVAANAARSIARVTARDGASSPFIPVLYNRLHEGQLLEISQEVVPVSPEKESRQNLLIPFGIVGALFVLALVYLLLNSKPWKVNVTTDDGTIVFSATEPAIEEIEPQDTQDNDSESAAHVPTITATSNSEIAAPTVLPDTPTDTPTPTSTPTPTATATPQVGDILSVPLPEGEMEVARVFVPRGSFLMGTDDGATDEGPEHEVRLDAFWMDRTEVTNEQYAACVAAGECSEPKSFASYSRANYYLADGFAGFPVIHVTWYDARRYCTWAGGSLPTEAQWEYAARSPEGRVFPWGDEPASCAFVNYAGTCNGDTDHVESRPVGKSWVNALNLAGNVTEWVNDWFSSSAYGRSVRTNPQGTPTGLTKVLRGGAWDDRAVWVRSFSRYQKADPDDQNDQIGFRCAYPVTQP